MKRVLILGITGNFGRHMAATLLNSGWQLRALQRPGSRPAWDPKIELFEGDAADLQQVRRAAKDVDVIVYGVNPPNYDWDNKAIPWLDVTATVAEENGLTIVFPGNVYVFDPKDGPYFNEQSPLNPISPKGETRLAMEQRLKRSTENGARVIVVRMGDYIADSNSAWIHHLIQVKQRRISLIAGGDRDLQRSWAYLPDACRATVSLLEKREQFSPYEVFHYSGHQFSFNELVETVSQSAAQTVSTKNFPWSLVRLMAPFSKMYRGLLEMRYLWEQPVILQDDKLRSSIDEPPHTPLARALKDSGLLSRGEQSADYQPAQEVS